MTDTTFIPDYLKPALERLAAARAAHLEQARLMEDTLTAITRAEEQKAELEQDNGSDIHFSSEDVKNPCHFECPHRLSDKLLKSSAASFSLRRGVCILRFPAAESSIYFCFSLRGSHRNPADPAACLPLFRVSGGAL